MPRQVAVVAMADPVFGEKACACVVLNPNRADVRRAHRPSSRAADRFASFKLPERLEVMTAFPVSPSARSEAGTAGDGGGNDLGRRSRAKCSIALSVARQPLASTGDYEVSRDPWSSDPGLPIDSDSTCVARRVAARRTSWDDEAESSNGGRRCWAMNDRSASGAARTPRDVHDLPRLADGHVRAH